jgi:dihydroneopterin aldolase
VDRILIQGLEFHGFHGVPAAEREIGHRYRVDAALELDLRPAGSSDDFQLTVDYGEAARLLLEIGTGESVQLVETLAERMAQTLIERCAAVMAVELTVTKVHPPVPVPLAGCAVQIRRTRA